jgi:hypothetical protein
MFCVVVIMCMFMCEHNGWNIVPNGKYWVFHMFPYFKSHNFCYFHPLVGISCIILESSSRDLSIDIHNLYQQMNRRAGTSEYWYKPVLCANKWYKLSFYWYKLYTSLESSSQDILLIYITYTNRWTGGLVLAHIGTNQYIVPITNRFFTGISTADFF